MFIEFKIGNFSSFRDIQKFTMRAAPLRANDGGLEEGNVFETEGFRLLKSKAIYGRNASGKSNLCNAISAFILMVSKSVSMEGLAKKIWEDRFGLITNWDTQPVFFEYIFLLNHITYRYGFQILDSKIIYEWLFGNETGNEDQYFLRSPEGLKIEEKKIPGSGIYMEQALKGDNELFRPDSLFLTGAALNGNKFAGSIRDYITGLNIVDGMNDTASLQAAFGDLDKGTDEEREAIIKFVRAGDTGIEDLKLFEVPEHLKNRLPKEFPEKSNDKILKTLFSFHSRFDANGQFADKKAVPFMDWESAGTRKLFAIGAKVLKLLRTGGTLIIDEFDARFHPNLTLKIVQSFHSEKTNPHHAQIIFITHDSGLLRRADLRRDQICFVNKDSYGISTLKTLIEYKGVRKDASYEKEYLNGNYDAIPFLDEMDWVLNENAERYGL
jgi:AAA15 family ATPase/GTPase